MKTLKTVKVTKAEADKSLTNSRRIVADRIFAEIYLDGASVEDHEGWEFQTRTSEDTDPRWDKKVYLLHPDGAAEPTVPATFSIVFEANSTRVINAMLGDKELQLP